MKRVVLTMIARNEESCIARCLASAAPYVDAMYVFDTGSTDKTVSAAMDSGAVVVVADHLPLLPPAPPLWDATGGLMDFAGARNVLRTLPRIADAVHLWLDADDVLEVPSGDRDTLRDLAQLVEAGACVGALYDYGPDVKHDRVRLYAPAAQRWVGPVHEVLSPAEDGGGPLPADQMTDRFCVQHRPPPQTQRRRELGRNLRIYLEVLRRGGKLSERDRMLAAREAVGFAAQVQGMTLDWAALGISVVPREA